MKTLKILVFVALGLSLLLVLSGVALVRSGAIDIAADSPHHPLVHDLITWVREQSISRHARNIEPPPDLADAERIRRGAGNYEAMCSNCHLAPGIDDTEIRKGLYPQPPDLTKPQPDPSDARRFWIIRHGIKASGMPAWQKGGMDDAAIWDLTAFLKALPAMTAAQYRQQVAASDGHNHGGIAAETPATKPDTSHKAARKHDHAGHRH